MRIFAGVSHEGWRFSTDNSLQSSDKPQQESCAMAGKPHSAIVKLDAASCSSPCDSMAFLFLTIYGRNVPKFTAKSKLKLLNGDI